MALQSALFLFFFFPLGGLLYWAVPSLRARNGLLLAASLVFYSFGQWQGIPVLLLSALVSTLAGRAMEREKGRRAVLALAVAVHLLLLGAFKYLDFFTASLNALLGLELPLAHLPLPMGISFFTFKSIAYVVDAYRAGGSGHGFADVLLYVSFFPQIGSGPIARFGPFAQQLTGRTIGAAQAAQGLRRFILGFGKKLLIAGQVAAIADAAFALGPALDARMAWVGTVAYSLQLYFDFSGYSDMAIGMAAMLGFSTPENFNYPYIAASIRDFWKRWHISLSSWFQDYLYIPLGGNRKGQGRAMVNRGIVFLLCGLWHGANWTFILWGLWHGVFSAIESAVAAARKGRPAERSRRPLLGRALGHVYTLLVVCIGFVIFRAADLTQAGQMLAAMFTAFSPSPAATLAWERIAPAAWCAFFGGILGSLPIVPYLKERTAGRGWVEAASFVLAAALFALCLLAAAGSGFQSFIYAQF